MHPAFLNQHSVARPAFADRMMVCKLAAYLENSSDLELPKQLNPCEVLS